MRFKPLWPSGRYPVLYVLLAIYVLIFLLLPVGSMIVQGFTNDGGQLAVDHVSLLLANPLYVESLLNSLGVAAGAAVLAACAATPIAMLLWRYRVHPSLFLELCGFLPLFVPPFVLAVSWEALLGRGGAIGLLFQSFGDLDPALWGLTSVMVVEALHFFPLVLMTLIMTTSAYSRQADEAASLGTNWLRLTTRVFLPLGLPGLAFGMAITFLKTLDDLATPLSLGVTNLLAPQAFFRVSAYGSQDPLSSLMATLMIVISGLVWFASIGLVRQQIAARQVSSARTATQLSRQQLLVGMVFLGGLLMLYVTCYSGVFLTSLARIWSYTVWPESFELTHYLGALSTERVSFVNTLAYCGFAAVLDVIAGLMLAYTIDRASTVWRTWLTWAVTGLLSVPGVALAIAYLQFFRAVELPFFNQAIDVTWFLLPMAFSVRGLPFAIRACSLALRSVAASCIEAASISGGSRYAVSTRIVLPMLAAGLFVAFLLCFGVAAADISSAMLLVPSETNAPVSYSIYLNMQSTTGRGAGSALAVLSIALLALSFLVLVVLSRRNWRANFRKFVFTGS